MENTFSAANLGRAAKPSELICALAPEVSLLRRGRAFRQTLYPQRETASSPKSAPDLVRVFRDTTLALTLASSSTFFRHNQPVCAITDTDQAAPHNGPPRIEESGRASSVEGWPQNAYSPILGRSLKTETQAVRS